MANAYVTNLRMSFLHWVFAESIAAETIVIDDTAAFLLLTYRPAHAISIRDASPRAAPFADASLRRNVSDPRAGGDDRAAFAGRLQLGQRHSSDGRSVRLRHRRRSS